MIYEFIVQLMWNESLFYLLFFRIQYKMSQSTNNDRIGTVNGNRSQKIKEIDILYRNQIKQIYAHTKSRLQNSGFESKIMPEVTGNKKQTLEKLSISGFQSPTSGYSAQINKSASTLNVCQSSSSSKQSNIISNHHQKIKSSFFIKEESISKMDRLQNLFKIKNQENFFKVKLQIVGLLQEFGVPKEDLSEINEVSSESTLYSFLAKKLKTRLKDFRIKEQQSSFQLQKDKIVNQKHQQRIHYLMQTNQLLRLSQAKLKAKIQDLKNQLNDFLQRLKEKQELNEQFQSQIFQLKRSNEELNCVNQRLAASIKSINADWTDEKRIWQVKEKQMKTLLNNYFVQKKKLQNDIEERQSQKEEIQINQKFLEQQNERLNRELMRWKQRYQGVQKEKENEIKELHDEFVTKLNQFQQYKAKHNVEQTMGHQSEMAEALRKLEEYQRLYERSRLQLAEERELLAVAQERFEDRINTMEEEWIERVKSLQKLKDQQFYQIINDNEARVQEIKNNFLKRQKLLSEQMQARLKATIAQKDRRSTAELIEMQQENDRLRKQIDSLKQFLRAKQDFINVIRQSSV